MMFNWRPKNGYLFTFLGTPQLNGNGFINPGLVFKHCPTMWFLCCQDTKRLNRLAALFSPLPVYHVKYASRVNYVILSPHSAVLDGEMALGYLQASSASLDFRDQRYQRRQWYVFTNGHWTHSRNQSERMLRNQSIPTQRSRLVL